MLCRRHGTWNCMNTSCFSFYQGQGYSHPGMIGVDYNMSDGTLDVVQDLGGGIGYDVSNGDLVIETPLGDFDI